MARRRRPAAEDEEVTEGIEPQEEQGAPAGAEFVPEAAHRPKSDVYTLILILSFLAFLAGSIVAGREAWQHYDVQFFMFTKEERRTVDETAPMMDQPVSDPGAGGEAAPPPENQ